MTGRNQDYHNKRRFKFINQIIFADEPPRIGVCNLCRAVVPFDTKRTNMHHEKYHTNAPLKDTLEVCNSCHNRIGWETGLYHDKKDSDYWRMIGRKGLKSRYEVNSK